MMGRIWTVARRELAGYFDHATAYILLVVFLVINFFFYFRELFVIGEASLRPMLGLLPWLFLFFVPAVCMRALAEERREGTLELVLAQPIGVAEFLLGKALGVYLFLVIAMAATLGLPLGLSLGADLQAGVIFAQYLGSALMLAALVAVGLWASSMTQNQVTAFILGVTVTLLLYLIGLDVVVLGLPAGLSAVATRLGILGHFQNVARGVIDLRDVLYFLAVTAAFLALTYFAIMRNRLSRRRQEYRQLRIGTVALVALAILVALAGSQLRGRLDLTPGKLYTLSTATRELLQGLDDLVTITFFRSDDLPPEYGPTRRDVEDLLRDFDAAGGGNLNLVPVDPADDEEAEEQAAALGIEQARFNVLGDDEFSFRDGYLGVAVQYAGQSEVIPLLQRATDLEYRLASMIRGMTRDRRPVVGMLTGHGELDPRTRMRFATGRLGEDYAVQELRLDSTTAIPDTIDAVVLAGTTTQLAPWEGDLLSRYLDRGGSALILLSGTQVDAQSRFAGPALNPTLDSLLQVRGLGVAPVLAFDLQLNATVRLDAPGGGLLSRYPLFPSAQVASDHVIVDGLGSISMNWPSPIRIPDDSTRVTTLLATTEYGGELRTPVSIDASQDWPSMISEDDLGVVPLGAAYQDSTGARIVLVGSHLIADDQLVGGPAGPAGIVFVQNAIDWLAQDEALISIRSKDRAPPALLFPSEFVRDLARYGNLVGIPLLFVLFGVLRLARRRRAEARVFEPGGAIL